MNISSASESPATRTGKVGRLPKVIRDRLNQQLRDNVPGKDLVCWLNAMPTVRQLLAEQFHGRVITPQNLSEEEEGAVDGGLLSLTVVDGGFQKGSGEAKADDGEMEGPGILFHSCGTPTIEGDPGESDLIGGGDDAGEGTENCKLRNEN